MVNGLLARDFAVYEDGKKQNLNFFTTDPFALSVAVIFDVGMADVAVQKVNQTFSALEGAFSQFDEVSSTPTAAACRRRLICRCRKTTYRRAGQPEVCDWQKQWAAGDQRPAGSAGTDRQRRAYRSEFAQGGHTSKRIASAE